LKLEEPKEGALEKCLVPLEERFTALEPHDSWVESM